MELIDAPIFQGISAPELACLHDCFGMRESVWQPEATIYDFTGRTDSLGILVEGTALTERVDARGSRSILERLGPGSVFGDRLMFEDTTGDLVSVIASTPCRVWFMDGSRLTHFCPNACAHHTRLVENLFRLMTAKATSLAERVEVLSRRSIREKLLCFFRLEQTRSGDDIFPLPFTLGALADYISADRSAMMRELRKMRQEGLVEISGKKVRLPSSF